jgi:hypothetical protein
LAVSDDETHRGNMICVNAQVLGAATVLLPVIGVIVGLLLAGVWH